MLWSAARSSPSLITYTGRRAKEAVDDLVGAAEVLVDHGSIIHDIHVGPLVLHELCVPQRRRVAPPADDHGVGGEGGQGRRQPMARGRVARLIDRRVVVWHGEERSAR